MELTADNADALAGLEREEAEVQFRGAAGWVQSDLQKALSRGREAIASLERATELEQEAKRLRSEPERPQPKYEKGQRVDMDGGIAGVAVPVTLTVAVRRWFQPDGWTYDLADNESRVIHWYDIPESDLRPHTMTVADLTPAQRRIQPGRKVRVKAIQNREDGGVIEGADRDEPNKEVTVLSMRPFQGAFVCIIHADTWCWPWNLELVEEGGA